MRPTVLVTTSLAATALGFWVVASRAQVIDGTPCSDACYEKKAACVTGCGEHQNPIECEEECEETLSDCLRECQDESRKLRHGFARQSPRPRSATRGALAKQWPTCSWVADGDRGSTERDAVKCGGWEASIERVAMRTQVSALGPKPVGTPCRTGERGKGDER